MVIVVGIFALIFGVWLVFNMVCAWLGLSLFLWTGHRAKVGHRETYRPGVLRPSQVEWDARKAAERAAQRKAQP